MFLCFFELSSVFFCWTDSDVRQTDNTFPKYVFYVFYVSWDAKSCLQERPKLMLTSSPVGARLQTPNQILLAAARLTLVNCASSYSMAFASSSFCCTLTNISHLCSSGRQLLRGLHGFVPPCLIQFFWLFLGYSCHLLGVSSFSISFFPSINLVLVLGVHTREPTQFFVWFRLLDASIGGVGLSLVHRALPKLMLTSSPVIIQCSRSKKSALFGKSGAQSALETQFLAYPFLTFCSARKTT